MGSELRALNGKEMSLGHKWKKKDSRSRAQGSKCERNDSGHK